MDAMTLVAIAGPPGSGKTTWLSQFLSDQQHPRFYCCPGLGDVSVDRARIAYRFPWVQLLSEQDFPQALMTLPEQARVYLELGFHLDLTAPILASLPCHRVAIVPPELAASEWHDWADEVIIGSEITLPTSDELPELWRSPLTGRVFDPASLDEIILELTGGAYGSVQRLKGIFELPDGRAFHIDFVEGLSGIEYAELGLPPWLDGRPERFSGIEVLGRNLDKQTIVDTFLAGCLSDSAIAHYQEQYKALAAEEAQMNPEETVSL
ncbi:MAG: GTP-binding protein [Spirulina sp. SIO3F2]|nr:GTP-binding protein [Spirulina sp. SIO3F2]